MAAKHNSSQIINASMEQMQAVLTDPLFSTSLKMKYRSGGVFPNGANYIFLHDVNLSSWGENVNINIIPMGENSLKVDISSECALPTQIIDWGQNKKNVDKIFNYISQNLFRFQNAIPVNAAPTQQVNMPAAPVQQNRFCNACGTKLSLESRFCHNCGTKI